MFERTCPKCNNVILYKSQNVLHRAVKKASFCRNCSLQEIRSRPEVKKKVIAWRDKNYYKIELERHCPKCNKIVVHKTTKGMQRSKRENKLCRNCSLTEAQNRPDVKEKLARWRQANYKGDRNPFFGKSHTEETKKKIVDSRDETIWQSDDFKEKMSIITSGPKNPMFGKSVYDVWLARYGKEETDRLWRERAEKISLAMSGANNPMYGKPAPKGSGGGWSGWYKNWYFRSLRELSYMIEVIERFGHVWESAECNKYSISYTNVSGEKCTYRADFLLDGKILVEVKPIKLMNTPTNCIKRLAAEKFCKIQGWEYRIVDSILIDLDRLSFLCESGEVKLILKWKERLSQWKKKQSNQKL